MGDSILAYAEKRLALPGKERLQLWNDTLVGEIVDKGEGDRVVVLCTRTAIYV